MATGDLVAVSPLKSCGQCASCSSGEVQWCEQFGLQGGGYAEYAITRPNQCVKLPKSASLADGAIIEPLAVALHGVNLSEMKAGGKVLVLGAGPIGPAVAFWAKQRGAAKVVVQDLAEWQRPPRWRWGRMHSWSIRPIPWVRRRERWAGRPTWCSNAWACRG